LVLTFSTRNVVARFMVEAIYARSKRLRVAANSRRGNDSDNVERGL
jgi:hypothetical protein